MSEDQATTTAPTMEAAELEIERLPLSEVTHPQNKIIHGDNMEELPKIPDASIDLVVTDPPYGISFMGKHWDKALPSVDVWRECLRVLKPGAFAFVMCIPRQDCLSRMIINLEDAGFMVNFSPIMWTYATGFPKAANLSKLADKRAGVEREKGVLRTDGRGKWELKMQKQPGDGDTGVGHADGSKQQYYETAPATPEAKALDGAYAGFQPKPAVEVVIVAMKPLTEKTYLDQALANGKGCTWLDAGRIPYETSADKQKQAAKNPHTVKADNEVYGDYSMCKDEWVQPQGRFAPNLLCSDDVLNDGKVTKSGVTIQPVFESKNVKGFQPNPKAIPGYNQHNDSGSFSRYFSLDSWAEANLPESVNRTFPFLIVPKASKSEKNAGLDGLPSKEMYYGDGRGNSLELMYNVDYREATNRKPLQSRKNHHPTCKPIKLMSYLIAIGSRPGDVVLDPYAGSGTTGIAAALADRRYILIELDPEYVDIGQRRIAWHVEQAKSEKSMQLDMFEAAD